MAVEADVMSSIAAQVMQGVPKDQSTLVADEETSAFWDKVAADREAMTGKGYIIDQPADITGSVMDYFEMAPSGAAQGGEQDE